MQQNRRLECPKCSSMRAWIEEIDLDVVVRCLCGVHTVLETKSRRLLIYSNATEAKLPKLGSLLRKTLMALRALEVATTGEVQVGVTDLGAEVEVPDVASYLSMLRNKGLVEQTINGRGVKGGSTWRLSAPAINLLGVN